MEQMDPNQAKSQFLNAIKMEQSGDLAGAETALRAMLEGSPGNLRFLCLMGRVQRRLGKFSDASRFLNAARAMSPQVPPVIYELAMLASDQDDLKGAATHLQQLTKLQPGVADSWFDLGLVYERSGNLGKSINAFRKAIQLGDSRSHETYTHLAAVLALDGQDAAAKENFEKALELDPDHPPALLGLGMVMMAFGDFKQAMKLFRRTVRQDPTMTSAYQQLAAIRRFDSSDDPDIQHLSNFIESPDLDDLDRETLHFALGKMLDDCEEFDAAFRHYSAGNKLKLDRVGRFDFDEHDQMVDRIRASFDAEFFSRNGPSGSKSSQPLFIVGMPRSGTSLVEQILASHARISGAGEVPYLEKIARHRLASYANGISGLDERMLKETAAAYLEQLQLRANNLRHITNKYPSNFLHLGLIHALFPNARIVHCRRNPLDVCLSIYFQDFAAGNLYANSLGDLGRYYQSYQKLMKHWDETISDRIHTIDYEALVNDMEGETRKLLDWLGVEWDPACLDYTRTNRAVSTMSRWQVRQPVYNTSIDRWRHYEQNIGGLRAALGLQGDD